VEETEPGINKRVQYFKEDMIANEDPEVIVSKYLIQAYMPIVSNSFL
jgi:hypothetical protein